MDMVVLVIAVAVASWQLYRIASALEDLVGKLEVVEVVEEQDDD